jgi:hypothetical protein
MRQVRSALEICITSAFPFRAWHSPASPARHIAVAILDRPLSGRTYPRLPRIVRVLCAVAGRCCQPLAAVIALLAVQLGIEG